MLDHVDEFAVLGAVFVFVFAVFTTWLLRRLKITDSVVFMALLLLPLATYGIASGALQEMTLPGGWAFKFRELAKAEVEPAPLALEIKGLDLFAKEGISGLEEYRHSLTPGKPLALTLELGRRGYYQSRAITDYIRTFLSFDPHLTVVFEDAAHGFRASSNGTSVLAALALDIERGTDNLVEAVENADLAQMKKLVALTTQSVTPATRNADALAMMLDDGVDSIVAIDDVGRPTGIVRRDDLISRLMVKLASG